MMPLFWYVLLPIIVAVVFYVLNLKKLLWVLVFQGIFLFLTFTQFLEIKGSGPLIEVLGHFPTGVGIPLRADAITVVMMLLNVFLFTCMILFNYEKEYMNKMFLLLFLILEGLINGIFLAHDLFNIYVLIELSTIVVSILIMFKKDSRSIYDGMLYLLINIVSMAFFLLGVGYMYKIFGSLDLSQIKQRMPMVQDQQTLIVPYALLFTGVGLKSAIMPLFSWLPRAHGTPSAPSIVSAILSGLYVKGGIYLFIRFQDLFQEQIDTWMLFIVLGFMTAIVGVFFSLAQEDIKLILAYSTVSQIGLIIIGISLNHPDSYYGSIYHILNHAIFKSVLFLTAGMIIESYGTRKLRDIRGVYHRLPFVAITTIVAILGITGAPLFNGSISKSLIQKGIYSHLFDYGMILVNIGTIMIFIRYSVMLLGKKERASEEIPVHQKFVMGLLSLICFIGGIFGTRFIEFFYGVHIKIDLGAYLSKSLIYLLSLGLGYLFYRYIYNRIQLFKKIRELELGFNAICLSIVVFFVAMLGYLRIFYI